MSAKDVILSYFEEQDEKLAWVAREIWDHPEIGLQETFASKLLSAELEQAGFTIEHGVGQMPTAFVASWGEGQPIVGLLGEYDALPGLSQGVTAVKTPLQDGGPGHGCGHNLFGTASMGAAIALKEAMQAHNIPGTVRFYGCPAEETLVGKTFMARDGVFDDLDAAIAWHPSSSNIVWHGSSLAMNSFKVNFYGVAAHGAGAPHLGRSALDGVMLMDVGVNYLREHIIQEARIHCVVTSGGQAPNVVPPYAQVWYFVRAPRRDQVEEIYERVLDIAKGAALMSGTSYDVEFITGCYDVLPNNVMSDLLLAKMQEVGGPTFTPQEIAFAKSLQDSFPAGSVANGLARLKENAASGVDPADYAGPLVEAVLPHNPNPPVLPGSTEVGDVSWITPTGQITTCCWPIGTPPHSWQTTASSGSSIGAKGMMTAAKAMSLAALALMTQPELRAAAQAEFQQATAGKPYVTPLPEGAVPS